MSTLRGTKIVSFSLAGLFIILVLAAIPQGALAQTVSTALIRQDCAGFSNCYTSLAAWESSFGGINFGACPAGDLVCTDKVAVAQIDSAWTVPDMGPVVIDGWTTNATHFIKIFTTPQARHTGKWDDNKYRLERISGDVLAVQDNHVRIDGLQMRTTAATASSHEVLVKFQTAGNNDVRISNNIIRGSGINSNGLRPESSGTVLRAWNNIIYDAQRQWFGGIRFGGAEAYFYNNTIINSYSGIRTDTAGVVRAKNNLVKPQAGGTGFMGTFHPSSDFNAASDATGTGGLNDRKNQTFTFIDATNGDFHLALTDTGAKGFGTDLSTDANLSVTDDIDGEFRTAPFDIGADEPAFDITPPAVSVTSPLDGQTVSGMIAVTADANDNLGGSGVAGVQFKLDGVNLGAEDTAAPYDIPWDTKTSANGLHTLTATARDAAGNSAISVSVTVSVDNPPDLTPPVMSGVTATSISSSGATVMWTTDEPADSQVEYGETAAYGLTTPLDPALTTSHSQVLSGLSPATLYHYRVKSQDFSGNLAVSGDFSFTTLAVGAVPTIDVINPLSGTTLSYGAIPVEINVSNFVVGAEGTDHLHFYVDADPIPYQFYNRADCTAESNCIQYNHNGAHTHFAHWMSPATFEIFALTAGTHTIRFALANAADVELTNPEASEILTFSLSAPPSGEFTVEPVATGLDFAIRMAFAPDGRLFYTEKEGNVRIMDSSFNLQTAPFYTFPDIAIIGEQGVLGVVLDPDFALNKFVYVYYSSAVPTLRNRVVRLTDSAGAGIDETVIIDNLPAADYHNGGNLMFGLDGKLYISTGDASASPSAQDVNYLGGKILRLNPDGTTPTDNPFPGSPVYALGLRNPFGTTFMETGDLWVAENGPTGNDEVNRIVAGGNYGWPIVEGIANNPQFIDPLIVYNPAIAPTGIIQIEESMVYPENYHHNLFMLGFNDGAIHRIVLTGPLLRDLAEETIAYGGGVGGLLDAKEGLDGFIYMTAGFGTNQIVRLKVPDITPPAVAITSPLNGQTVSSTITIAADASDNLGGSGVVGVQFKLDGVNLGAEDTAAPYDIPWDTKTSANGLHTLTATARDAAGNAATSAAISVTVDNPPDTTSPSIPAGLSATAISSSQINISWTASTDDTGVAGYRVYRDGAQIATTTITSYSDIGLAPSTLYTYTVAAFDAAGNVSPQSSPVSAITLFAPSLARIQSASAAPASCGSSVSLPVSSTGSGNLIVVAIGLDIDAPILSVTDNATGGSNVYQLAVERLGSAHGSSHLYYAQNSKSGATAVTATFGSTCGREIIAAEYSGVAASGALDLVSSNSSGYTSSVSWTSNATLPTAQANELLIGVGFQFYGKTGAVWTAGTNWTSVASANGSSNQLFLEEQIVSQTGSYAATGSFSAGPSFWYLPLVATFRAL